MENDGNVSAKDDWNIIRKASEYMRNDYLIVKIKNAIFMKTWLEGQKKK